MSLPAFNGIKSAVLNYQFPWLFFKMSIFSDSIKIPWIFPDFEEIFSLTCGNDEYWKTIYGLLMPRFSNLIVYLVWGGGGGGAVLLCEPS